LGMTDFDAPRNNHGWIAKGQLCDLARDKTGATGEHTGRMAAHFLQCEMFPQINQLQSYPGSIVGGGSLATSRSFSSCNSFSAWCQNSSSLPSGFPACSHS
jgi:hypothetical protein